MFQKIMLAPGVLISRAELDMVKAISGKPASFARNLMRRLFTDADLEGRSLFGRKCNANKDDPKPSIDANRRDAMIRNATHN